MKNLIKGLAVVVLFSVSSVSLATVLKGVNNNSGQYFVEIKSDAPGWRYGNTQNLVYAETTCAGAPALDIGCSPYIVKPGLKLKTNIPTPTIITHNESIKITVYKYWNNTIDPVVYWISEIFVGNATEKSPKLFTLLPDASVEAGGPGAPLVSVTGTKGYVVNIANDAKGTVTLQEVSD